jgi:DNA-binding transcriptional ArsR family regulator
MTLLELKAKLFRGLGDTSRRSILATLRRGPSTVSEIVAATVLLLRTEIAAQSISGSSLLVAVSALLLKRTRLEGINPKKE